MRARRIVGWIVTVGAAWAAPSIIGSVADGSFGSVAIAQQATASEVTFAKDIAPILQRSCQNCHRPAGVAPMSLVTYEEVRPWARAIKTRTGIGPRAGVMPPWYVEDNIGIQHYKDDPSLSAEEIAKVAKWADSGAPLGSPADMPPAKVWADDTAWRIGKPDIIVKTKDVVVKGNAPDWWGEIESVPVGLTEDRYVAAIEIKEVNDVPTAGNGRHTVGGRFVFHHMIWSTRILDKVAERQQVAGDEEDSTGWPVHEVGRNPDYFDPRAARLLRAGSHVVSNSVHLHSNGRDTKAHLEIGFKLHPKGYKPMYRRAGVSLGNGVDIDIKPMEAGQQLHAYAVLQEHTKIVTFEPHLHAPGMRMCLEAIWGINIETLTCAGYDHNWVRGYAYDDDHAPLLPKGTILHIIGYMDNSPANKNIPDPRNWQGSGNRSVANMFIDLGMRAALTDEQFEAEMAERRAKLKLTRNDHVIGCPLCNVPTPPQARPANTQAQQQQ
jgi:hypothetical protein